jgi:hypothetical protein
MLRGRVLARRLALLAALAAAPACRRSPEARARDAVTTLRSWEATVRLAGEERARGTLPQGFADQVERAAEQGRRKAEQQLREAAPR